MVGNAEIPVADVKPVSPEEAAQLLEQGYLYVDVRSEPEFALGHPPGALNVPISHKTPAGMAPNTDFLEVMQRVFAKGERLVLGCASGPRSRRAAQMLAQAGFTELCEMSAGFSGGRDAFGRPLPGWKQNLPVETGTPAGQSYADVKLREPA
ncbi:MAG TPA: rhodanese-like domain-containing protein [Polyangiaceae bacterium]|jgi:rhodanese-related sulfurtransferase|nr:rhodanese-like domain-containing protein [Polyangiaceae bacterium]